jgi:hypothetical protein
MYSTASSGKPKIVHAAIASSSLVEPNRNPNRHRSAKWARTVSPEDLEMTTNDTIKPRIQAVKHLACNDAAHHFHEQP